jgi:hypothetical protein
MDSGTIVLADFFRRAALRFLAGNKALSGELRAKLLGWRHFGGFSAHNLVRVAAEDREGRMKLAGYMMRAPMSLEKMSYDAATSSGQRDLARLSEPQREADRTIKGLNFFDRTEQRLLRALQRPEFNIHGVRRADLKPFMYNLSNSRLSRQLHRLRSLGLIKRVTRSYRYYLTRNITTGDSYFTHRLVRTERIGNKVRQVTLLNLGRHFAVAQEDWPTLCPRIEESLPAGIRTCSPLRSPGSSRWSGAGCTGATLRCRRGSRSVAACTP